VRLLLVLVVADAHSDLPGNVLILRGDIHITPSTRQTVSYSYLSSLVGDYLLRSPPPTGPTLSLESALEILPSTQHGLNLNPRFGSIDGFRQEGEGGAEEGTGELALFARTRIPLVHGWIVDPQDEEAWEAIVEKCGDYDRAVEKIVEGEIISGGELVEGDEDEAKVLAAVERRSQWSQQEEEKVREAHLIRQFLSTTSTQLTYYGLFLLSSHLAPSSLSALFRNSHLSVLFRRPSTPTSTSTPTGGSDAGPALFTLVTDASFADEPEVVWESLEDVDGGSSEFYDGTLRRSSTRGGDWVAREGTTRRQESAFDGGEAELRARRPLRRDTQGRMDGELSSVDHSGRTREVHAKGLARE
jgi:hypothetical protein